MSKKELVNKTNSYLEKLSEDNLMEVYNFIEYVFYKNKNTKRTKSEKFKELLLNGPIWSEEDENFFYENNSRIRKWRTN